MGVVNEEQAAYWAERAPRWLETEEEREQISEAPGRLGLARLELSPGQRVLDVGCGSGRTTVALAAKVAPGGEAVGVDIAAEMLVAARRHAGEAGVGNARFVQADAQAQDLGEEAFDAAFSRFGVMFFSDPVEAFANLRRALRPGGALCFVCWDGPLRNEWMSVPVSAATAVLGPPPPRPSDAPGPFSLADPDRVRAVLTAAGFDDVDVEGHTDQIVSPASQIPQLALHSTRVGLVSELLRDAHDETRDRVRGAIEDAFRARGDGGELRLGRAVLVVNARA